MPILVVSRNAIALTPGSGLSYADGALYAIESTRYTSGVSTWTKSADATMIHIWCVGSGGGAGSGARNTTGLSGGGGGGSGAGWTEAWVSGVDVSTLTITVGTSGSGGSAVSAAATAGNNGTSGNPSYVGSSSCTSTPSAATCLAYAIGGLFGAGGSTTGNAAAGQTQSSFQKQTRSGGVGSLTGAPGAAHNCNDVYHGPGAGAGGSGGVSAASGNVSSIYFMNGCQNGEPAPVASPATGTSAPAGADGATLNGLRFGNGGGGGGGAFGSTYVDGGRGGNGGTPGGGGGGGGGSLTGTSGSGGNGGSGVCVVTSYY